MSKADVIEIEGVVVEKLPNAMPSWRSAINPSVLSLWTSASI